MTAHTETITEFDDSVEPSQEQNDGFLARRRMRKKLQRRTKKEREGIEIATDSHAIAPKSSRSHESERPRTRRATVVSRSDEDGEGRSGGTSGARRIDLRAREELEEMNDRREFLRRSAIGAGVLALGAGLGYGSGYAHATGLSGNTRTVITDSEVAARVIGGVRIATEFIPDPVPAGTDADPYPGSAIQAALIDGFHVYVPSGTWRLTATIARAVDGATIIGAGRSTKLVFDGVSRCISAGTRNGWLIANLAVDAGGVDVSSATESRFSEVWVNGVLTDNRPIGSGGGGTGGYYGVRAADFVTSGDGSPASPYNASAIQAAIDALPLRGGTVFVKEGVWRGSSRITVNATGSTPYKKVVFQGAGTAPFQIYNDDSNHNMLTGTHVQAGFDCYIPCDFYDMAISPTNRDKSTDGIAFIQDPTKVPTNFAWTQGLTIKRIRFHRCNRGIWFTGANMGSVFWQTWGVRVEQCGFVECNEGVRVVRDDFGSTAPSQGSRMTFTNNEFRACTGRAFNYDVSSSMLEFSNTMLEGCGAIGGDYAFYVNTYGDGGVTICNVDFGDGAYSKKVAKLYIGRNAYVNNFSAQTRESEPTSLPEIDIGGRGLFRVCGDAGSIKGGFKFNLINAQELTVEQVPRNAAFGLGAVDAASQASAATICIRPSTTPRGFIGTTTPSSSPYTYTNLDMYEEMIYLVGGTISDITRSGQSIGTDRSHYLRPGDSIVISYTAAPTIRRFGVGMG